MMLSENFWDDKYLSHDIGWDLGAVSNPLKSYIDQLEDKSLKILIPGGGNSYEAEYLYHKGFKNVFVLDISLTALSNIKRRVPLFPESQLIHEDFFSFEGSFDLIIEQTFFCAIDPKRRLEYATKTSQLLKKDGKLIGVLFNIPLNDTHPPFGGNRDEYINYFNPFYHILIMEPCYNSIEKRTGNELFLKLLKK